MHILFFGDVVGKAGREILARRLGPLRRQWHADVVIVNGENAAAGMGITPAIAEEFFRLGVDVITLGNHAWDRRDIIPYIDGETRLIRPLNFPPGSPGFGSVTLQAGGVTIAVLQVHGRVLFPFYPDDPFRAVEAELERLSGRAAVIVVDVHAEATSEKQAMGWFLDGRVTAVCGTHTHVQTADGQILPGGTAYITDVGMCGPYQSVIGMDPGLALQRLRTQMPVRLEVAKGPAVLSGVAVGIDPQTGKALSIATIQEWEPADGSPVENE